MAKKHPHVRCIYILSEGAEEKGGLGRVAGEEIQSGGEEDTPFLVQWGMGSLMAS